MSDDKPDFRLGILTCVTAARDASGRLLCNHSNGRLIDVLRDTLPGTRLCLPILPSVQSDMKHELGFAPSDVVALPPLESVVRSQRYYFRTRRIARQFAREVDVLFIRLPFQVPGALLGLGTPKLLQVAGNAHSVVLASSDYRGLVKRLAVRFALHSNNTIRRMVQEPHTRTVTHGSEMWKLLGCRDGRVVVSSCIYRDELRPRADLALGDPPRLLFVGYLRPEKGALTLLDAFERLRKSRPLKLTVVGGNDKSLGDADSEVGQRIRNSPYRDDIHLAGMMDFGEPLFDMYRGHDVFVLPSLSEGTPRTLVEARAFGCPAVATRVGGIPSSVQDGKTGLLVEAGDSVGLASAIERVLADDALRRGLIAAGLQTSHEQTVEHFAGQLVEELRILVRESRRTGSRQTVHA